MSDEELADFLSENISCNNCVIQCQDKERSPSMSSCYYRCLEWLRKETD